MGAFIALFGLDLGDTVSLLWLMACGIGMLIVIALGIIYISFFSGSRPPRVTLPPAKEPPPLPMSREG